MGLSGSTRLNETRGSSGVQLVGLLLQEIPEAQRTFFSALAEHADSLGYRPRKTASKDFTLDFSNSAVKRTLLKLEVHANAIRTNGPGVRFKFHASTGYSEPFREGIRRVIEAYGGKYVGCYGCGRCAGEPEGYVYEYPDGRRVFRCGNELIAVDGLTEADLDECRRLMSAQAAYFDARRITGR